MTDWGLTRSDITYDVVHVWDGAFFRLDDHLARFIVSLAKLRLDIPQTRDDIKDILNSMVAASGMRAAYVSMVASRGTPKIPGTRDPRACANHFFAWAVPFVQVFPPQVAKRGAHILIADGTQRIPPQSVDSTVKNYHWGDLTHALIAALDAGYDSTLLLDLHGNIAEGPGFNVFAVIDGTLVTPAFGVLEGITRKTVIEIGAELGLPVQVRDIPLQEFLAADEVFTATSAGGPVTVTRVNQRIYGNARPGRVTKQIIETYWDWHKRPELISPIDYSGDQIQ